MALPGCEVETTHTDVKSVKEPAKATSVSQGPNLTMNSVDGKEVYSSAPPASVNPSAPVAATSTVAPVAPAAPTPAPLAEDDLDAPVEPGTKCKRQACGKTYISDALSRHGDGEEAVCVFHPLPGYLCCKRKVLEFDEFLKIEGCTKGRHLFVPQSKPGQVEELVNCRIDHYQTPTAVHVSIFAKKVDKEKSKVVLDESVLSLELYLPDSKRFSKSLNLFGPINPAASSWQFFGTKVEVVLAKKDGRSWNVLEKTTKDLGAYNLTFGVGGRTGTVGAKEVVLDEGNQNRSSV
ncbi:CS-domain-containing protein [Sistotremastrum niveocremeum HHB9708]|uniref:CS-domain-containing protein n=1 Tax=Sistotremastrum niveocremeum HHB9708 TaxID=1314777 RepID=A0A165AJX7_9AGAM|nr:CS-domain-containing protein [Sistotremastrum niveocremeum HHB9708]